MIKILTAAAVLVTITTTAAYADPPWRPLAETCWASVEQQQRLRHPGLSTSGALIYTAAACTARYYPDTKMRSDAEIQAAVNRVYIETYNLSWSDPPDRVDAVMAYLLRLRP